MERLDSWKRPSAVDDAANVQSRYTQQLELQLNKLSEATPEEFQEWQEKELDWWADRQFSFIIAATIIQFSALGFMLTCFYLISQAF